jgi:hypothetical protein
MLSSHPDIYIPPESDFIPWFFGRNPVEPLSRQRIASILETIFSKYRFAKEWQGAPPGVDDVIEKMKSQTPAGFLDALYSMYAGQYGAARWGDKTPIYASYIPLLHQMFPQARFVHIIRDGRDVALSMLDKWEQEEFHVDIYFAAKSWVRRITAAQAAGAKIGPQFYTELRYENLVENPERELPPLCAFLEIDFVPAMAQPHRLGRERIAADTFHAPVRQPPSAVSVGRWQQQMSPADLRLFQRIAGRLLARLDYPPADVGPTPGPEQLRTAVLGGKYHTLQAGRRVLQAMGFFPPN